jgi:uncharacterized membrane protein
MPMKFLVRWAIPSILLAAILHLAAIRFAPELLSSIAVRMVQKSTNVSWNEFTHGSLLDPDTGASSVYGSPDIIYSMAFYDLTKGLVRLHCVVPTTGNYWSVSLYAWNLENFFVENDSAIPAREFDLVLAKKDTSYQPRANERLLISPTTKGAVFLRAVISARDDREQLALIAAAQKKSRIELLTP